MSTYNLTSNLQSSFDFSATVDGKENKYVVKYPSQKELEPITRGYSRLQELDKALAKLDENETSEKDKITKEAEKIGEEITKCFNDLFKPEEGSMPIGDLLEKLPINARKEFNKMISTEFNVEAR